MSQEILSEVRNGIGLITLNRPAALNALSFGMIREMHSQLTAWKHDSSVHAVLVQGAGEKAFCAGGDIRAIYDSMKAGTSLRFEYFADEYRLDHLVYGYPKPYLALMNGICMGGGMGIAQGARHRIVSGGTRIAMPETGIGFFPDVGGSYFLSRLPGALGMYLGLTGQHIRAADALYATLADSYLAPQAIAEFHATLTKLRWTQDHGADIAAALHGLSEPFDSGATLPPLRDAIDEHFAKPDVPAMITSLRAETRFPEWSQSTLDALAKRSPLMLWVTARQIQLGKTLSLADCFRMELTMVHRSAQEHDFAEGIRALLIDKDNTPRWEFTCLEDVPPQRVDAFFASPWTASSHPLANLRD